MTSPLLSFTAEELPALALVFALALAEPMSDDDALLLASFLSTISADIGLFVTRRSITEPSSPTGPTGPTGQVPPSEPIIEPTDPVIIPRGPRATGAY